MSQPSRRKGGLGRGLASLIPTGPAEGGEDPTPHGPRLGAAAADVMFGGPTPAGAPTDIGAVYREIDPALIEPNPRQPRQVFDDEALSELVHSIREFGLMQPIVVRALDAPSGARYQLVMGERRWRAAQTAGLTAIPAIVRETADDNLLRDALLENIHRAQLNPLEEAAAYQQLLDEFDVTHEELAARIGRSRPLITNMIRLLRLPIAVQRRVAGVLTFRVPRMEVQHGGTGRLAPHRLLRNLGRGDRNEGSIPALLSPAVHCRDDHHRLIGHVPSPKVCPIWH